MAATRFLRSTLTLSMAALLGASSQTCSFSLSGLGEITQGDVDAGPDGSPPDAGPVDAGPVGCAANSVCYDGNQRGRIYITPASGGSLVGATSIDQPGAYSIALGQAFAQLQPGAEVPLFAWMDVLGTGTFVPSADPAGTTTAIFMGNELQAPALTLQDPDPTGGSVQVPPAILVAIPFPGGAVVAILPALDAAGEEFADHYQVKAISPIGAAPVTKTIRAGGAGLAIFTNLDVSEEDSFTVAAVRHGIVYPESQPFTPPAPAGDLFTIHGDVSFGQPLFTALPSDRFIIPVALSNDGTHVIGGRIAVGQSGATQLPYTIEGVPDGTYSVGFFIDRDGDGELGPTDFFSFFQRGLPVGTAVVNGADAMASFVTLPSGDSIVRVCTTHWKMRTGGSGGALNVFDSEGWGTELGLESNRELVVRATLTGGSQVGAPQNLVLSGGGKPGWRTRLESTNPPAGGGGTSYSLAYSIDAPPAASGWPTSLPRVASGDITNLITTLPSNVVVAASDQPGFPTFTWQGVPEDAVYFLSVSALPSESSPQGSELWRTQVTETTSTYGTYLASYANGLGPNYPPLVPGTEYRLTIAILDGLCNASTLTQSFLAP